MRCQESNENVSTRGLREQRSDVGSDCSDKGVPQNGFGEEFGNPTCA